MKKVSILFLGIMLLSGVAHVNAKENEAGDDSKTGIRQEVKDLRHGNKDLRMQNEASRTEFKEERKALLDSFKMNRQEDRAAFKDSIKNASGTEDRKILREDFMKNRKADLEEFKTEIKTKRDELKLEIKGRRDEIKQRIASTTPEIRKKLDTVKKTRLDTLTNNLEQVFKQAIARLTGFNTRIDDVIVKLESNGKDTTTIKSLYATAQANLSVAQESVTAFPGKISALLTGTEASRQSIQTEIEYVRNDIKKAREAYKAVIESIKESAGNRDSESTATTTTSN